MRPLWPIEREALGLAIQEYPPSAATLGRQIESARVARFENTGAGFFSHLAIAADTPHLSEASPLDSAHGLVSGIDGWMGFLVFLEGGRLSMLEGFCTGDASTAEVDFSRVAFRLVPSSSGLPSQI